MLGTSITGTIGGARWGGGGGECVWSWGKLEVGTWAGLGVGVGLNSRGEELWLIYSKLLLWGMHGVTREDQSELTVRCLLYSADAVVLHWGRLRQYLRGGDGFVNVNPLGPKYVSQGAVSRFR